MQRYHAGSCTRAVNNSRICGPSAKDTGRMGSSSLPTNFPASSSMPVIGRGNAKVSCSCTRAVNNSTIGGSSARDIGRIDSSSLPTNFPVISSFSCFCVFQIFPCNSD
ncbi:hypothetical protein P8452_60896 [Trifolium repens]|nr:hypothetical protein P8452_60896 [Trifolium repens]